MATVATLLEEWAAGSPEREVLVATEKGVTATWLNRGQERFAANSEMLQDLWQPTITSTGNIALPANFVREIKDMVHWDAQTRLREISYAMAQNIIFSITRWYSIWNGTFYVWMAAAGSPSIAYIKKPTAITTSTLATADLELPSEYHRDLFYYLDSQWLRRNGDLKGSAVAIAQFDQAVAEARRTFRERRMPVPMMRGVFF